ncbi:tetratricopeptide repeat protein [Ulvibacter antarcticus]|uniref:Tetratricopeptide repeat protein n=1 Tax=Ulvibacter antarcticus TaxID=442714 RepID=A0A3L9YEP6_9FLAO|nr:hypothetical protein [Ulvibacter antarcticus]RMA57947.1 tetratricopeptide repeat protein [Ulvibacter antarcticus]
MNRNKYIQLCLIVGFALLTQLCAAQKEADSLLAIVNQLIYEDPDKAIEIALEAYEIDNSAVKTKVNALLAISVAYSSKRDYQKSLEYAIRIESYLPKIKNEKLKMNVLNRIGAQYQELKIHDKAIEYLEESQLLIENYPNQDSVQALLGYNSILRGFIYREQMNCDIALTYFTKAIDAYLQTLSQTAMNANVSICYYNQGNCLLTLKRIEEAENSYLEAIKYSERVDAKSLIAFAQKGLAEVKTLEGDYTGSIAILNSALMNAEKVGDLVLNRGLYLGLSTNYLALNDWENYTVFNSKYLELEKETKLNERKSINQSLLSLTEGKAKEIEQLKKRFGPIQIGLVIIIFIILLMFIRDIIISEKKLKKLENKLKN